MTFNVQDQQNDQHHKLINGSDIQNGKEIPNQLSNKNNENGRIVNGLWTAKSLNNHDQPFTLRIDINIIAWLLFIISFVLRFWRIDQPRSIVFDELHYGKFVSLYLKGIFFFDSQPPFGKQLIALAAYISGYNGDGSFTNIGSSYDQHIPLKALRFVPALCGSLIVPVVYHLIVEVGLKHKTAILASIFIILENSLLTQSRFILMETILLFFTLFGLLCFLKSLKQITFTSSWFAWLFSSSIFITLGFCVKYIGITTYFLVLSVAIYDFWQKIGDRTIKTISLWIHFIIYLFNFICLPLFIYLTIFYIHLSILTNAGPHDNIMTSAFQASLEGGLASITKGQPLEIAHGSQITLRHTHGRACWLHSHQALYPIKYPDKRGSSHQQQVTCYSFKDVNNWWIVKRPEINELVVSDPIDRIKHGDVIQLVHGMSGRALNSHDVAAPMSPQNQEVSCYIDYNISMPAQNLWKVELMNSEETGGYWHTIHSQVHLIHFNSSQALKFSGKQLPDWGFNQHEVVTDKLVNQDDTIWNVEEHRHGKNNDAKEREREIGMAEFVPLKPTQLSFWEKIIELQYKMLIVNQENVQDHVYSCDSPIDWITLTKGIAYWISSTSNAQIHLIGNLTLWYLASASVLIYLIFFTFYLLRRRRKIYDIPEDCWRLLLRIGQIFAFGYFLYLIPYFVIERTLFLHHYLPALVFKLMLLAAMTEHFSHLFQPKYVLIVLVVILSQILYTFIKLLPLSYGSGNLTAHDVLGLKLKQTWQLIIHK